MKNDGSVMTMRRHNTSVVTKTGHLPQGAAFWGFQIEIGRLRNKYEMSNARGC